MPEVLDRVDGVCGELVLRRVGTDLEVIANGMFLMDTRNGESERLLVTVAADLVPGCARLLIGGLGVGYSLRAALDHPGIGEVVVVEREPAVIGWNRTGPLREVHGNALAEERVRLVRDDLVRWLRETEDRFDALCLDIDNGPQWTVTDGNAELYGDTGLDLLAARLRPGGVLAVWSAAASPEFTRRLRARFNEVRALDVPVPRGEPDVIWLARI
ncbi:spermidine synthase [Amycolatopsis cihanbeyliensis]|uniref:Spermine/spermidine synthase n=1 Tax=Amycolatopsis cihanbeyliensis TaxID=1128664 RepID=A0A542DIX7_AMYCI|nr:spermidine synthase [Amycolatopsis cihanbeyliensis]TQJ03057.1 spermine/spermidine synthase [Amycolatopsis cihanbeyliensis]